MTRRFLVISSVGRTSVHRRWWLRWPTRRTFDLCLICYEPERCDYEGDADLYLVNRDTKFRNVLFALAQRPGFLDGYDHVFVPDDDIRIDTDNINRLFECARTHRLPLAQPALSYGSVSYWSPVKRVPWCSYHLVPFVEANCPCFSQGAFQRCRQNFAGTKSTWGLDIEWPVLLGERSAAVVDRAVAYHVSRPSALDEVLSRQAQEEEGRSYLESRGVPIPSPRRVIDVEPRRSLSRWRGALREAANLAVWVHNQVDWAQRSWPLRPMLERTAPQVTDSLFDVYAGARDFVGGRDSLSPPGR